MIMTEITKKRINWGVIAIVYGNSFIDESTKKKQKERKEIVCPSLLSIGRSTRDTLIVMKVEPLCNEYVLDSLK